MTLDLVIEMGARVEAGEADLRDIFEENEEPADDDEERGREANEKQLKKLSTATTKLKSLRRRIEEFEENLKRAAQADPEGETREVADAAQGERQARTASARAIAPSAGGGHRRDAPLLQQARDSHTLVQRYEEATGRSKSQLLHEAAEAEDRRHLLKINGSRENLLDIAARIKEAQKTIKAVERRVKVATGEVRALARNHRVGPGTRAGAPSRN